MSALFVPTLFLAKSFFFFFCFLKCITVLPFFYGTKHPLILFAMVLERNLFGLFSFSFFTLPRKAALLTYINLGLTLSVLEKLN